MTYRYVTLQTYPIRTTVRVVHVSLRRLGHGPLVPHFMRVDATPHVQRYRRVRVVAPVQKNGRANREIHRKPRKHQTRRPDGMISGMNTASNATRGTVVEQRVEVCRKSVKRHRRRSDLFARPRAPGVPLVVDHVVVIRVHKLPHAFRFGDVMHFTESDHYYQAELV